MTPDIQFTLCPDVGGAMRLGGSAFVADCSLLSNSATTRGLAVAMVGSANITGSSFGRNELYCEAGSYREDREEEVSKMYVHEASAVT